MCLKYEWELSDLNNTTTKKEISLETECATTQIKTERFEVQLQLFRQPCCNVESVNTAGLTQINKTEPKTVLHYLIKSQCFNNPLAWGCLCKNALKGAPKH